MGRALRCGTVRPTVVSATLLPEHVTYIATIICIYAIGAIGPIYTYRVHAGRSFGQAGFLAIGAYTFGHLARFGMPWPVTLLCAGLRLRSLRRNCRFSFSSPEGPYLAIATMGFGIAVYQIFANSELLSGGRMGLTIPKLAPILGMSRISFNYYFNLIIALIFALVAYNIISSYMGRAFIAIRDNDIAAEVIGVNLRAVQIAVVRYQLVFHRHTRRAIRAFHRVS